MWQFGNHCNLELKIITTLRDMEKSKLGLDFNKVAHAKELAKVISDQVQDFVDGYSTVACERTLCRLMGVDGIDQSGVPLPNVLVDFVKDKGMLANGILPVLGNAVLQTGKTPCEIAEQTAAGTLRVMLKRQERLCNLLSSSRWSELKPTAAEERTTSRQ